MSLLGIIVDNYGQTIELTVVHIDTKVVIDISSYTTKQIQFKDPGGTITTKTAAFITDGTDGKIDYDLEEDLIDTDGTWKVRAKLSAVAAVLHSKWIEMPVEG